MTSTPKETKPTPEPLSSKTLYLRWMAAVVLVVLIAGWVWYRDYHTSYGVEIVGVNHTDDPIGLYVNGNWGGGVAPHSGGAGGFCCVSLPKHWYPGMTVHIKWETTTNSLDEHIFHERDVPVAKFELLVNNLHVHFLPHGEIKVLVPDVNFGHPDYPIKDPI